MKYNKKSIYLLLIAVLIVTGCSFGDKKMEKYQNVLEEYGRDYYEKYQKSIINIPSFEISIENLKNANEQGENYNLDKLSNCNDVSKVTFDVNEESREIEKVTFEMNCK